MKCIEISNKILLTVMVLSACGLYIFSLLTHLIKLITISYHGIGTKHQHAKMENRKESE